MAEGAVSNPTIGQGQEAQVEDPWLQSMQRRYDEEKRRSAENVVLSRSRNSRTIYRVPSHIRRVDVDAYTPQLICIGPYHRRQENLQPMEDHKWRYLRAFLSRDQQRDLVDYIKEMKALEEDTRSCYSGKIELTSNEFSEMMLLDGCFMIELFFNTETNEALEEDDPVYYTNWTMPIIMLDMLLLENQLPFFVLRRLLELNFGPNTFSIVDLAYHFFKSLLPQKLRAPKVNSDSVHHLLHLLHLCLSPELFPPGPYTPSHAPRRFPQMISTATQLKDGGIKFKCSKNTYSLLDIVFKEGVVTIPTLWIDDSTNSLFRNLIALEQCYPSCGNYFTSYAIFMDCLIDTTEDVAFLRNVSIIQHGLGSDMEVALLFNNLSKGIALDHRGSYFKSVFNDIIQLVQSPRHKWLATLKRTYFGGNPMSVVNLEFTVMGLLLTAVQTFIAFRSN